MIPSIDFTLYNQIKAKFSALPNTILFISITSENPDELIAVPLTPENFLDLRKLVKDHWERLHPYAAIGSFEGDNVTFLYVCSEFIQEEDLKSGKILESEIGTFKNIEINLEGARKDLAKFSTLISGNA